LIQPKYIEKFSEIITNYNGYIFDQYGVLHNGEKINTDAEHCLIKLIANKKKLIILSNSGKTENINKERMYQLGSRAIQYIKVITSGDVCRNLLVQNSGPFKGLGKNYYIIGSNDSSLYKSQYVRVDSIAKADFCLLISIDGFKHWDKVDELLNKMKQLNLTLVCANPDLFGLTGDSISKSSGTIAAMYKRGNGKVINIGKPYMEVYNEALNYLKINEKNKILMIGDSIHNDILGANRAGIDSLFITSGIHKEAFKNLKKDNFSQTIKHVTKQNYSINYYTDRIRF